MHRLSRCGRFQHHWHYLLNSIPWWWIEVSTWTWFSKDPPGSGERSPVPWQWEESWQVSDESCYFHPTNKVHGIPTRISFPCPKCGLGVLFRYTNPKFGSGTVAVLAAVIMKSACYFTKQNSWKEQHYFPKMIAYNWYVLGKLLYPIQWLQLITLIWRGIIISTCVYMYIR